MNPKIQKAWVKRAKVYLKFQELSRKAQLLNLEAEEFYAKEDKLHEDSIFCYHKVYGDTDYSKEAKILASKIEDKAENKRFASEDIIDNKIDRTHDVDAYFIKTVIDEFPTSNLKLDIKWENWNDKYGSFECILPGGEVLNFDNI